MGWKRELLFWAIALALCSLTALVLVGMRI